MSTRANIIISQTFGNSKKSKTIYIILYSHYDGYPSGVGSDLKNKLLKLARCKNNFGLNDVKDYIQSGNDFTYEITDSIHGDIEYLYLINIDNKNKEFKLTCYNNGFYDKVEKDIAENGCNKRFEIFSVTINYSYNQWVLTKIKPDTLNEYKCLKEKNRAFKESYR